MLTVDALILESDRKPPDFWRFSNACCHALNISSGYTPSLDCFVHHVITFFKTHNMQMPCREWQVWCESGCVRQVGNLLQWNVFALHKRSNWAASSFSKHSLVQNYWVKRAKHIWKFLLKMTQMSMSTDGIYYTSSNLPPSMNTLCLAKQVSEYFLGQTSAVWEPSQSDPPLPPLLDLQLTYSIKNICTQSSTYMSVPYQYFVKRPCHDTHPQN